MICAKFCPTRSKLLLVHEKNIKNCIESTLRITTGQDEHCFCIEPRCERPTRLSAVITAQSKLHSRNGRLKKTNTAFFSSSVYKLLAKCLHNIVLLRGLAKWCTCIESSEQFSKIFFCFVLVLPPSIVSHPFGS